MQSYLKCLRTQRGQNAPECRFLAKDYLSCRMERNLMAPDEFKNLGFTEEEMAKYERKGKGKEGDK
jgi:hypothetical protein